MVSFLIFTLLIEIVTLILSTHSDDTFSNIMFGISFVMVIISMFGLGETLYDNGYEDGQVDAINGEYKYEMKIQQDTTYIEVN